MESAKMSDVPYDRYMDQVEYGVDLQRVIEGLCGGKEIPLPQTSARHHYDMAVKALARIEAQAALIKELAEALRYYEDQFCEGFCDEYPEGFYVSEMDNECSGCRARAALAKAKAVQS
jgi:hypothetical protein